MTTKRANPAYDNLLTPDNHALLLIDHQYLQLITVKSHDTALVDNNATAVAKAARLFEVPTLLTTAFEERQKILKGIQEVFPEQEPIDRLGLNSWDDDRVRDWVEKTGKQKLVMCGLWTEVCLSMPVLDALGDGYEVYIIPDASGGATPESHEIGVQRMVQAGARPLSTLAYLAELQRDWAREETAEDVLQIFVQHGGAFGSAMVWEWDLLENMKEGTR